MKNRKWLVIVGVIVALAVIGTLIPSETETSATASEETAAVETKPSVKLGETLQTKYFAIMVSDAKVEDRVNTGNQFADIQPEQGNKFLIMDVVFKNTDKESRMMTNGEIWIESNGETYKYEHAETVMLKGWGMLLENINPQVTKSTKVEYKIPDGLSGTVYYHPSRAGNDEKIEVMQL